MGEPTTTPGPDVTQIVREQLEKAGKLAGHFRFDLAVLGEGPRGIGRDLETLEPSEELRLLVEFKALNRAGQLKRSALQTDIKKLQAALDYCKTRPAAGIGPYGLLVVVATGCKDAQSERERDSRIADVIGWCKGLWRPSGPHTCVVCRDGLYIDGVLARTTLGAPEPKPPGR